MPGTIKSLNDAKLYFPQQTKQLISKTTEKIVLEAEITVEYKKTSYREVRGMG